MRFAYQVLKACSRRGQIKFYSAWKSATRRFDGKVSKEKVTITAHLGLYARLWLLVQTAPFRLRKNPKARVILYNSGSAVGQRKYFYKRFGPVKVEEDEILALQHDEFLSKLWLKEWRFSAILKLFKGMWVLNWIILLSFFQRSRVNPHWKVKFGNMLLQQLIFHGQGEDQLFFFCYEPDTYLSSLLASYLLPGYHPKVVSSNSMLFRDNRYLYHPKLDFKLCSKFQEVESKSYTDMGWMVVNSRELWGLEEIQVFDQLEPQEPRHQIGIYSSGSWARTHDLWRSADMELLRQGGYQDNPLYLQLKVILDVVLGLKREFPQLSVKFYLHPHELRLIKNEGIKPPYLHLLDENGLSYQLDGKSSLENIYEAELGLAVSSTLLFDRMHIGLKSYFYAGYEIPNNTLDVRYLGEYGQFGYRDGEHLRQMLMGEFKLGNQ